MKHRTSDSFSYRGVDVALRVERARGHVFGHADLLAEGEFMGRVSLGSARSVDDVRDRLRCLAKAKVDMTQAVRAAEAECARTTPAMVSAPRPQDGARRSAP